MGVRALVVLLEHGAQHLGSSQSLACRFSSFRVEVESKQLSLRDADFD